MTEFRRDPIVGRWVIVSTDEPMDVDDFHQLYPPVEKRHPEKCFFCPGRESDTPPEVYAVRPQGGEPNSPGWTVRVVPNKFPALVIEGDLESRPIGLYDISNGVGAHEVVIETPDHFKTLADLSFEEVCEVIKAYRARINDLKKDLRFQYILVFKNFGAIAGASIEHDHSQIIALPLVPKNVKEELEGAKAYFDYRERCIFCDMWRQERDEGDRVVYENNDFITFCPFSSRFPFEMWIVPKYHCCNFPEITDEKAMELAKALKDALIRLKLLLHTPPYNFIIHASPLRGSYEYYHWHIEIMPRISRVAGFEWGSGFYVVPTTPELCAERLRKVIW